MQPHWEHGYRCHGYWLGLERLGFVGLPPRFATAATYGYGWSFGAPGDKEVSGRTRTLRAAKKAVEQAYQRKDGAT